ncbi:methyltransferase-like protein 24 [Sinocyclocheilus grahami]|uniref:methyltransferase-like protein 24 n=1 Tax=Sinocyclocheilus grahami TaxID=75366 RepID=UPI0007ACA819|nr:PREDICTED: methyltransferase-like protein 24 [Sinocyclocheilus grahami]
MHGLKGEMNLLRSCRKRTSACRLLLRMCLLLCLLCVCAHVYMQLEGLRLQKQSQHHRTVATATDAAADAGSTCCLALNHHRRVSRWKIWLEPWAAETRGLQEEADRFLRYISTPQLSCQRPASVPPVFDAEHHGSWLLCLDRRFSLAQRIVSKHCRVYSLRSDDALERLLAGSGCEVHCFDPSIRRAHLQEDNMWLHRLSVDWRDPNPAVPIQRLHSGSKKLAAILSHFGHRQVDVLKVDLESAEWKILGSLPPLPQLQRPEQATPLPAQKPPQHQQLLHTGLGIHTFFMIFASVETAGVLFP